MISFKNRMCMAKLFMEWAREYNAVPYPESVIAWLQMHGLLDEEKVYVFLNSRKEIPKITFVDARYGPPRSVTATELVQIHRQLLETNLFQVTQHMEWQNDMMKHFKQIHEPKLEFHTADPHRDNMDHWVFGLYAAGTLRNLHDSEKDAGSEYESNDIHKEETSK